jgi:hypothetical protein
MDTRSEVIAVTSDVGDAELVGVPKPSLFRRIIRSGGFFLSTQANLVNAGIIHMIILFVLFVHFFYTVRRKVVRTRDAETQAILSHCEFAELCGGDKS